MIEDWKFKQIPVFVFIFTWCRQESCSRRERARCSWEDISEISPRRPAAPPDVLLCCTSRRRRSRWGPCCSRTSWSCRWWLPAAGEALSESTLTTHIPLTVWRAVDWLGRWAAPSSWSLASSSHRIIEWFVKIKWKSTELNGPFA